MNDDDGLAPMVDGLSGALCVLVLVVIVFLLASIDTLFQAGGFRFAPSTLDMNNQVIYYSGGVSLSNHELYMIRKSIESNQDAKRVILYGVVNDKIVSSKQKNLFNVLELRKKLLLKLPSTVSLDGQSAKCGTSINCVYWEFE